MLTGVYVIIVHVYDIFNSRLSQHLCGCVYAEFAVCVDRRCNIGNVLD